MEINTKTQKFIPLSQILSFYSVEDMKIIISELHFLEKLFDKCSEQYFKIYERNFVDIRNIHIDNEKCSRYNHYNALRYKTDKINNNTFDLKVFSPKHKELLTNIITQLLSEDIYYIENDCMTMMAFYIRPEPLNKTDNCNLHMDLPNNTVIRIAVTVNGKLEEIVYNN